MKAVLLLAALSLAACSAPGSSAGSLPAGAFSAPRETNDLLGSPPRYQMQVAMFDAPLSGLSDAKVNIAVLGMQLLQGSAALPFVTNRKPQVINLLDLQDHAQNFEGKAPGGQYTGVRLLIDPATSSVNIAGHSVPIVWGSPGHPTTSKVVAVDASCPFSLSATDQLLGGKKTITLDFNVMESVRFVNGTIYVQPSVSAANLAAQVRGKLENAAGKPVASAAVLASDAAGHVVNSTVTKSDGSFVIHALPPGLYAITVKNQYQTASGETFSAVNADSGAAPSAYVVLSPKDDLELDTLTD